MNKKLNIFNINIIFILILEILFSIFIFKSLNILSIIMFLIEAILLSSIISIITFKIKQPLGKILNTLILMFINILFISQFVHYKFYNAIYSFYSLLHSSQVFAFFEAILKVIKTNLIFILIFLIPVIVLLIIIKKTTTNISIKNIIKIDIISIFILLIITTTSTNNPYSIKNLYTKTAYPILSTKKLGLLTTMNIDIYRYFNKVNENFLINDKPTSNIEEYLNTIEKTKSNEYTGIFKDKNLIYITAESFSPIAIDKYLTPTLYKMSNYSFEFTNFYAPIYYVSTSDGEYINLLSLLPEEGVWSLMESKNNYYPYNYAKIFKGYEKYAYHNGEYNFYERYLTHSNLGYKFKGCGNGLEKYMDCSNWPNSDLEMISSTFKDYKDNEKFIAYYMSISGHLNYKKSNNKMTNKNYNLVKSTNYSEIIKGYLAANIELDKALEKLLKDLEENNLLDKTVIVISPDHYPYGLTKNEINSAKNYIKDEKFDIHKNSLIIYSNDFNKNIKIDKYISNIDILPTILNLFGQEYDSRLLIGNDIFKDKDGLIIYNDRSWMNKYGKYDALTNKYTKITKDLTEEEIRQINIDIYNKFVLSRKILDTNYYKKKA